MKHLSHLYKVKYQTVQVLIRYILAFPFSITKANLEKSVSRKKLLELFLITTKTQKDEISSENLVFKHC